MLSRSTVAPARSHAPATMSWWGRWKIPPTSSSTASGRCTERRKGAESRVVTMPHRSERSETQDRRSVPCRMEFRRINALPPYAFATIDALKMEYRRAGTDVIDLGFGNPDLPSPNTAVEKLIEA